MDFIAYITVEQSIRKLILLTNVRGHPESRESHYTTRYVKLRLGTVLRSVRCTENRRRANLAPMIGIIYIIDNNIRMRYLTISN